MDWYCWVNISYFETDDLKVLLILIFIFMIFCLGNIFPFSV